MNYDPHSEEDYSDLVEGLETKASLIVCLGFVVVIVVGLIALFKL